MFLNLCHLAHFYVPFCPPLATRNFGREAAGKTEAVNEQHATGIGHPADTVHEIVQAADSQRKRLETLP
jgi:hypothetical protein